MTLKTSFKEVVSLFLTNLIFVSFLPFLHLSVHADSATGQWAQDVAEGVAQNAANAVVSYYTSVDVTTLEVCEQALAFGCAVGQDLQYAIEHSEDLPTVTGSSQVSVGQCIWTDSDGVNHNAIGSVKCNTNSISFMCSDANAYCLDAFTTYSNQAYTAANVQSVRIRYQILMGKTWEGYTFVSSYFDSSGSADSHGTDYKNFDIPVKRSSGPAILTPTSFSVSSFGLGSSGQELVAVKSGQTPIEVTPDYSSPEALYQSSQDYYNGLLEKYDKDLVDQFWYDFPDPSQEETTVPDSSGCCCQPFTLPSEWVQSDVVELETDHYTVPYTDLVRNPYDYLVYGVTAPPPPVTPADDAKKAVQTKTATKATRSGDPIQDLQNTDYEMYEALTDYSSLLTDILDRSGVLPYWAILMAAGALFLII